jgi:uncharacterized protein YceK
MKNLCVLVSVVTLLAACASAPDMESTQTSSADRYAKTGTTIKRKTSSPGVANTAVLDKEQLENLRNSVGGSGL